ncbi:MAG: WbqC family protein [Prolixibacteraceae bacterium]
MEQSKQSVLLSSAYLAPVQYYTKILSCEEVWIDLSEHFLKQSYRNRCAILTANGTQNLTVPVTEGSNSKRIIRDVLLSWDHPWQKLHWKALLSAYNNAPFFEYYADSLAPFYHERKWKYLTDFNIGIQTVVMEELNLKPQISLTTAFYALGSVPVGMDDFRYTIDPKPSRQSIDENFRPTPYMQVFQEKFGFTANLSILDLLFNEGPMAMDILKKSIIHHS